jgi:hypothetical protein
MTGKAWTGPELRRLRRLYPRTGTADIARALGGRVSAPPTGGSAPERNLE